MQKHKIYPLAPALIALVLVVAGTVYTANRSAGHSSALSPQHQQSVQASAAGAEEATGIGPTPVEGRTLAITVVNGAMTSPSSPITVKRGEPLHIQVSDTGDTDEIDIRIPDFAQNTSFSQGSVGDLDFTPNKSGTFPIYFKHEEAKPAIAGQLIVQ